MKKQILIGLILIILGALWFIYKQLTYTYITVQFKELRPFEDKMPVYYKGIVIGKATEKKHTDTYSHTLLKVILYPKNLHLPSNTEVYLKQIKKNKNTKDFLELVYPENPSDKLITNGTYLKGINTEDIESYMKSQKTEDLNTIKQNLVNASANLDNALEGLSELFLILQDTIKQNQENLQGTTYNLKQTTDKLNNSIKQQQLENTFSNVETSINNLQKFTQNINNTTTEVNNTLPNINSTIKSTQEITANTSAITCGIRQTLGKRYGGLRLFFGKTINEGSCCCGK